MQVKESIQNDVIKNEARDFLSRRNKYSEKISGMRSFHHTLRHEILFGLAPRTFEPGKDQRACLQEIAYLLTERGFLRDQGLNQLGTIIKFSEIINETLDFKVKVEKIEDFCSKCKLSFIVFTL